MTIRVQYGAPNEIRNGKKTDQGLLVYQLVQSLIKSNQGQGKILLMQPAKKLLAEYCKKNFIPSPVNDNGEIL